MVRIAINGLGRLGRIVLRSVINNNDFEIVAINDFVDTSLLVDLLKYEDKNHELNIESTDNTITINNKEIKVICEHNYELLPWNELNIDAVFECFKYPADKEVIDEHLKAGAKHVLADIRNDLKERNNFEMVLNDSSRLFKPVDIEINEKGVRKLVKYTLQNKMIIKKENNKNKQKLKKYRGN